MRYRSLSALALGFLLLAPSAMAKNLFIPVVALAGGENNTTFRTDVRIFNPSTTESISVSLHLVPAGIDGRNFSGVLVNVGPREMKVVNNVVHALWQSEFGPFVGTLRLDSDTDRSYEFSADSRTYTDSPQGLGFGTFGQFIPAMEESEAKARSVVLHLSNSTDLSEGFRTNAGVMNPSTEEATVTARLYHASAQPAGQVTFTVPPRGMVQQSLKAMFGELQSSITEGYLVYESTVPVFGYASVVDNDSGDQIFVRAQDDSQ